MSVALLGTPGSANRSATSPLTFNFAVNSGTNRCLFIVIGYDNNTGMSVSGVTFNGVALTAAGTAAHNTTGDEYSEVWYLLDVSIPVGSQSVSISVSGTIGDIYGNAVAFSGTDKT